MTEETPTEAERTEGTPEQRETAAPSVAPAEEPVGATMPDRPKPAVLVAMLLVGLLALLAFAVLGYQTFTARLEAARKLDEARTLVEEADEIVVDIDEVVRAKVEPSLAARAEAAAEDVDKADALLARAVSLTDQARPDLNDDEREQAALLRASATTRRALLAIAPEILSANAQSAAALTPADEGWTALLEAEKLSDQAVKSYNKLTKAGVRTSRSLNRQAAEKLATAKERFEEAESAFEEAPFEDYVAYLGVRIRLNKLSQSSDKAWLADKFERANRVIREYNKLDAKAVKLASALPASPDAAVATAYARVADALTERYYAARDKALAADRAFREY